MSKRNKVKMGIVKFFDIMKGFGIIKDFNSSREFLVELHHLINSIKDNDKVEFEVVKRENGLNAIRVRVIN
jgi:cold shock CspA family protein